MRQKIVWKIGENSMVGARRRSLELASSFIHGLATGIEAAVYAAAGHQPAIYNNTIRMLLLQLRKGRWRAEQLLRGTLAPHQFAALSPADMLTKAEKEDLVARQEDFRRKSHRVDPPPTKCPCGVSLHNRGYQNSVGSGPLCYDCANSV